MASPETIVVLNRVLVILRKSFPQYLRWARPYVPAGREAALKTLDEIVTGQDALAERVSEQIMAAGAIPDAGEFPMEFTDTHDLDIDYLIAEAIGYQEQDMAELEKCVAALRLVPAAGAFAAEAFGMAKGQLELLECLKAKPAAPTITRQGEPA